MFWYKLKTWHGGEEALVKEIRRTVPPYLYNEVFVIYNERNLRRQQLNRIEPEPLFPGCVFLTCQDTESLFRRLEKIPAIWRLISTGYLSMFPLAEEDAKFLEAISGNDHVVHASYVLHEPVEEDIYRIYGPLEYLLEGIEKIRFASRCAKVHKELWGEDTVLPLGILAKEDVGIEILYHGIATVSKLPESGHYAVLEIKKDETGRNVYQTRGHVTMIPQESKVQRSYVSA